MSGRCVKGQGAPVGSLKMSPKNYRSFHSTAYLNGCYMCIKLMGMLIILVCLNS